MTQDELDIIRTRSAMASMVSVDVVNRLLDETDRLRVALQLVEKRGLNLGLAETWSKSALECALIAHDALEGDDK